MGESLESECNFEEVFWAWNGILVKKTSFGYQEGINSSRVPMTEKALLPSNDQTYGMELTSESEDFVETECDRNERLLYLTEMKDYCKDNVGFSCISVLYVRRQFVIDSLFDCTPSPVYWV